MSAREEDGGESRHQMSVSPSDASHSSRCILRVLSGLFLFCFSPPRFNPVSNKLNSQQVREVAFLKNNRFRKAVGAFAF